MWRKHLTLFRIAAALQGSPKRLGAPQSRIARSRPLQHRARPIKKFWRCSGDLNPETRPVCRSRQPLSEFIRSSRYATRPDCIMTRPDRTGEPPRIGGKTEVARLSRKLETSDVVVILCECASPLHHLHHSKTKSLNSYLKVPYPPSQIILTNNSGDSGDSGDHASGAGVFFHHRPLLTSGAWCFVVVTSFGFPAYSALFSSACLASISSSSLVGERQ